MGYGECAVVVVARSRAAEQGLAEEEDWSSGPVFVLSHPYSLLTDQL